MGTEHDGKQTQRLQTEVDVEILSSDRHYMFEQTYSGPKFSREKFRQ
jgi:hypothetical protein